MRGLGLLCFILILPVLGALGHDVYVTYQDENFAKTMMFSNVQYLWTHYSPETYVWSMKNIDPALWKGYIVPVIQLYTVIAAGIPAAIVFSVLILLRLLGLPPFRDVSVARGHKRGQFGFKSTNAAKGRMKYKRK